MKPILLLYPPYEGKLYWNPRPPFPLGPLYMAAYLREKGIEAVVKDFHYPPEKHKTVRPEKLDTGQPTYLRWGYTDLQIRKWLRDNLHKYHKTIGVSSLMSSNYTGAYKLIKLIKKIKPDADVVIGGIHATFYPDHVLKNADVSHVFLGESELSFYRYIKWVEKGKHKSAPKIIPFELVRDMDSLPFPERDLLLDDRETKQMYVTFTRGCPHRCSFCVVHKQSGKRWRNKSVPRVIEEINFYCEEWNSKHFLIEDDNPCPGTKGIKYLSKICKGIIKDVPHKLLKFEIIHGVPMYVTADKDLSKLMWQAGFRNMCYPLESSNEEVLKHMGKDFTLENWKAAMKNWSKYEKFRPTTIILGYPFVDTIQSVLKTIIDVTKQYSWVSAQYFRLYHGTPIFDECLKRGYVSDDYDPINTQNFYIKTKEFELKDLKEIMSLARGVKFGIERDKCNVFADEDFIPKSFKNFKVPEKEGDVIAEGSFGWRRSQNHCAAVILMRYKDFRGRPVISFDGKYKLVYKGVKKSKVYMHLNKVLKKEGLKI
jgi:radical SAM superfamily enzyme YgiQ (UPF0313 family)